MFFWYYFQNLFNVNWSLPRASIFCQHFNNIVFYRNSFSLVNSWIVRFEQRILKSNSEQMQPYKKNETDASDTEMEDRYQHSSKTYEARMEYQNNDNEDYTLYDRDFMEHLYWESEYPGPIYNTNYGIPGTSCNSLSLRQKRKTSQKVSFIVQNTITKRKRIKLSYRKYERTSPKRTNKSTKNSHLRETKLREYPSKRNSYNNIITTKISCSNCSVNNSKNYINTSCATSIADLHKSELQSCLSDKCLSSIDDIGNTSRCILTECINMATDYVQTEDLVVSPNYAIYPSWSEETRLFLEETLQKHEKEMSVNIKRFSVSSSLLENNDTTQYIVVNNYVTQEIRTRHKLDRTFKKPETPTVQKHQAEYLNQLKYNEYNHGDLREKYNMLLNSNCRKYDEVDIILTYEFYTMFIIFLFVGFSVAIYLL